MPVRAARSQSLPRLHALSHLHNGLNRFLLILLCIHFGDSGGTVAEDDTGGFGAKFLPHVSGRVVVDLAGVPAVGVAQGARTCVVAPGESGSLLPDGPGCVPTHLHHHFDGLPSVLFGVDRCNGGGSRVDASVSGYRMNIAGSLPRLLALCGRLVPPTSLPFFPVLDSHQKPSQGGLRLVLTRQRHDLPDFGS